MSVGAWGKPQVSGFITGLWLFLGTLAALLIGWMITSLPIGLSFVFLFGVAVAVLFSIVGLMQSRTIIGIMVVAFLSRFVVGWLQGLTGFLPYGWDEDTFHQSALRFTEEPILPVLHHIFTMAVIDVYGAFSSIFYRLLGSTETTMRAVNALLGTLSVACIYGISRQIFEDEQAACRTALSVAVTPSYVLFTCLHMRDAAIWFCSSLMVYFFVLWLKCGRSRHLVAALLMLVISSLFRPQNLPLFTVWMLPFGFWFFFRTHRTVSLLVLFPISSALLLAVVATDWLPSICITSDFVSYLDLQYFDRETRWRAISGGLDSSSYLQDTVYSSWFDVFLSLPVRVSHFTFGPFLWNAGNTPQLLAAIEGSFFFVVCIIAVRCILGNWFSFRSRGLVLCLLWYGVLGLFANAAIDSNYGTAIRHRMNYTAAFYALSWGALAFRRRHRPTSANYRAPQ